jgi:hypothetical protein
MKIYAKYIRLLFHRLFFTIGNKICYKSHSSPNLAYFFCYFTNHIFTFTIFKEVSWYKHGCITHDTCTRKQWKGGSGYQSRQVFG